MPGFAIIAASPETREPTGCVGIKEPTAFQNYLMDVEPFAWPLVGCVAVAGFLWAMTSRQNELRARAAAVFARIGVAGFVMVLLARPVLEVADQYNRDGSAALILASFGALGGVLWVERLIAMSRRPA